MNAIFAAGIFVVLSAGSALSSAGERTMPQSPSPAARPYECKPPADWLRRKTSEGGERFSKGRLSINVVRHGGPGSAYRTPEDYLRFLAALEKPKPAGILAVSGRPAERFTRGYERSISGEEGDSHQDWVYEEIVLLRDQAWFWVLRFQSASLMYTDNPKGLKDWNKFLKNFHLR